MAPCSIRSDDAQHIGRLGPRAGPTQGDHVRDNNYDFGWSGRTRAGPPQAPGRTRSAGCGKRSTELRRTSRTGRRSTMRLSSVRCCSVPYRTCRCSQRAPTDRPAVRGSARRRARTTYLCRSRMPELQRLVVVSPNSSAIDDNRCADRWDPAFRRARGGRSLGPAVGRGPSANAHSRGGALGGAAALRRAISAKRPT
jgi:hypothetical protein